MTQISCFLSTKNTILIQRCGEIWQWECVCSEMKSPPGVHLVTLCFFMFVALVTVLSNKIWLCNQPRLPSVSFLLADIIIDCLYLYYNTVSSGYCLKWGRGRYRNNGFWLIVVTTGLRLSFHPVHSLDEYIGSKPSHNLKGKRVSFEVGAQSWPTDYTGCEEDNPSSCSCVNKCSLQKTPQQL